MQRNIFAWTEAPTPDNRPPDYLSANVRSDKPDVVEVTMRAANQLLRVEIPQAEFDKVISQLTECELTFLRRQLRATLDRLEREAMFHGRA